MYPNNAQRPRQQGSTASIAWWIVLGVVVVFVVPAAFCTLFQPNTLNAMVWGAALVGIAWGLTTWGRWNQKQGRVWTVQAERQALDDHRRALEMYRSQLVGQSQASQQVLAEERQRLADREQTLRGELEAEYQEKQCESTKAYVIRLAVLQEKELNLAKRERAIKKWQRAMRRQTLEELRALTPTQFELAMAELLRRFGFRNVQHVGGSGDQGVDLTCETPDGENVVVQCKRYGADKPVRSPAIQQFLGSIVHYRADRGLFITTSAYTEDARSMAQDHEHIRLIDESDLARMAVNKLLLNPLAPRTTSAQDPSTVETDKRAPVGRSAISST